MPRNEKIVCKSYCSGTHDYRCCRDCGRQFDDCSCNRCPQECDNTGYEKGVQMLLGKAKKAILIKYHDAKMERIKKVEGKKSDWYDLRAQERTVMRKGDFKLIPLGVSMQLPEGYEAHVLPRSSTFKNYGILMTNSMGIIDNDYNGDNDIWQFPAYATRDAVIEAGDRIAQFRIVKVQGDIKFIELENLGNSDRGGIGSTGKN